MTTSLQQSQCLRLAIRAEFDQDNPSGARALIREHFTRLDPADQQEIIGDLEYIVNVDHRDIDPYLDNKELLDWCLEQMS